MQFPPGTAAIRVQRIVIPTYPAGEPDHNPMFLEKRVYQGSSGAVYPFAVVDSVSDERVDREYEAVFLENDYLLIMVLPELGGRVQMAYAKHLDYHFIYYNRVIKPALVGLAGPWISGGIEFNWPQHHRPSSFSRVDFRTQTGGDGSVTLWLGETDRMHGTRGLAGLTLYPGRSYLEVHGRLFNRTALPETFLWWANIAVAASDSYQSVFPPDVHAVYDHGRRDVSRFPIATGTYYKVDYSPGTDISRYRNIPVPTSYMAWRSSSDFLGGYDHGRRAGVLHVSDHHYSPGKKQWTWGCGDFGKSWDRNLTDADGPYVELMAGVFTDNQPDFSWLDPGEEKRFTQYFMPYSQIGMVRNASRDAAIALDLDAEDAVVGVCSTSNREFRVIVTTAGSTCLDTTVLISPEAPFTVRLTVPGKTRPEDLHITVRSTDGEAALAYSPSEGEIPPVPEPARPALPPAEIESADVLYLTGLHLEQYRHATFRPEDYYEEALRRDPDDARCNSAMGLLLLRRGNILESEGYFRRAITRITERNSNPRDGEPFLYLGHVLELQEKFAEAEEQYFKASWNAALASSAFHGLARLSLRQGDPTRAVAFTEDSLRANPAHHGARTLKIIALRLTGCASAAVSESDTLMRDDPLNPAGLNERRTLGCQGPGEEEIRRRVLRPAGHEVRELALEYIGAGCDGDAKALLGDGGEDPLACCLLALVAERSGLDDEAAAYARKTDRLPTGTCFPNQVALIAPLELAGRLFPEGARSFYYLGNLLYDKRQVTRAVAAWERAAALDPQFPTVRRNLALAAFNKLGDPARARRELECALSLDPSDARLLFELDQLHKRLGVEPEKRLRHLDAHPGLVTRRDDLSMERASLLNLIGDHGGALELLTGRHFHPWEGGEGKVTRQYVVSLLGLSRRALMESRISEAVERARAALVFPESLGEGKLAGALENDVHYCLGCALAGAGSREAARDAFQQAAVGRIEPSIAMSYNDQPADMLFFKGLALARLGRGAESRACFSLLVDHAERNRSAIIGIDYFAVSLPDFLIFEDDLVRRNRIFCTYLEALGRLGLSLAEGAGGERAKSRALLEETLAEDPSHGGAREIIRDLENGWVF
jgi:tetratricopeptide (TPR) repeat protein